MPDNQPSPVSFVSDPIMRPAIVGFQPWIGRAEEWADRTVSRLFIRLAKWSDKKAQNGERAVYPAYRGLAFQLRKAVRES